ncbi:hypothetical protein GVY41_04085 [Frigidibacter albus]|uniref:Uncharacterized protein n=1 Tax=Frigidibacter albus TaxID=1465486 RepID=A0A6L8VEY9_9RHOB|nr:hypothetical protein [Frigidibacter albus]MZQ88142.1 hypothetical protein [Frigidibacter albus]NBE30184.1 hypothetical protein [Frigidibacter albus]GGH47231.1 hypothetical protein GCM10011341_08230 [Frigidibacter albus]
MPVHVFATMTLIVIAAAGATLAIWSLAGLPLAVLGVAALCASLILGWRGLRR